MPDLTPALQQEIEDYLDYLMSGPAGLGQNFSGFSSYTPAYLTGTYRAPYTIPITNTVTAPQLTVNDINITNITPVDVDPITGTSRHLQVDFASTTPVPFSQGRTVQIRQTVAAGSNVDFYNDDYLFAVVTCTTTSVLLQTRRAYIWPAYVSGGVIYESFNGAEIDTDCVVNATVTGPTDIVFVTGQLNELNVTYTCTTASEFDIVIAIDRYQGYPTTYPEDPEFIYDYDARISEQTQHFSVAASGTVSISPAVFTTVLDSPSFGLYRYYLTVYFYNYNRNLGGVDKSPRYTERGFTKSGTTPVLVADTTYTGVVPTTVTGIGSGAVLDITLYAGVDTSYNNNNVSIVVDTSGSDYAVGDILTVAGTDIGAASPANDLTLVITTIDGQYYPGDALPDSMSVGLRSLTGQVIKQ